MTKQLFGVQGVPERDISNNSPHYNLVAFKQIAKEKMFYHHTSSPKYSQSNGLAERCVQSMKSAIKKLNRAAVTSTWYCCAFEQLR